MSARLPSVERERNALPGAVERPFDFAFTRRGAQDGDSPPRGRGPFGEALRLARNASRSRMRSDSEGNHSERVLAPTAVIESLAATPTSNKGGSESEAGRPAEQGVPKRTVAGTQSGRPAAADVVASSPPPPPASRTGAAPAAPPPATPSQLMEKVVEHAGRTPQVLRLRLSPSHLGEVEVTMQSQSGRLELSFHCQTAQAAAHLRGHVEALRSALLARGYVLSRCQVTYERTRSQVEEPRRPHVPARPNKRETP